MIGILAGLAMKFGPTLWDLATSDDKSVAEKATEAVGTIAKGMFTEGTSVEQAVAAIEADPKLQLEFTRLSNEHAVTLQRMEMDNLKETQLTMRAEQLSEDWFVRRARPAFLWVTVFSIFMEVLIVPVVVFTQYATLLELAEVYSALAIPQGLALTACGVYMKKRSDDKTGQPAKSLLSMITGK